MRDPSAQIYFIHFNYFQRRIMLISGPAYQVSWTASKRTWTSTRSLAWVGTSMMLISELWTGWNTTEKLKHFSFMNLHCNNCKS